MRTRRMEEGEANWRRPKCHRIVGVACPCRLQIGRIVFLPETGPIPVSHIAFNEESYIGTVNRFLSLIDYFVFHDVNSLPRTVEPHKRAFNYLQSKGNVSRHYSARVVVAHVVVVVRHRKARDGISPIAVPTRRTRNSPSVQLPDRIGWTCTGIEFVNWSRPAFIRYRDEAERS